MKTIDDSRASFVQRHPDSGAAEAASLQQGIFLVEDHPITRAGLSALINREKDLRVCGEADSATTALTMVANLRPAVVVTDIALKSSNGIELMKNLLALVPGQKILAMSMHDENVYAERAIRAGARGYIMKGEAAENFLPAIRMILGGEIYLSERMKKKLLSGFLKQSKGEEAVFPMDTLSDREMEVFQLLGNGFTTREIALRLNLSTKTIDSYREHLKLKLRLDNSAELVRHAIRWARFDETGQS